AELGGVLCRAAHHDRRLPCGREVVESRGVGFPRLAQGDGLDIPGRGTIRLLRELDRTHVALAIEAKARLWPEPDPHDPPEGRCCRLVLRPARLLSGLRRARLEPGAP